jgi:hypothetical protein
MAYGPEAVYRRDTGKTKVVQAVGPSENLLIVKLDVTNPSDAQPAFKAAVDRFGA